MVDLTKSYGVPLYDVNGNHRFTMYKNDCPAFPYRLENRDERVLMVFSEDNELVQEAVHLPKMEKDHIKFNL